MKRTTKFSLVFLGVIILAGLTYYFQPVGTLEEQMARLNVPAVGIGIIKDGKIEKVEVIGELEKGKLAPENTIFNVASLTKPVFATVVLKLVENGKWDLDKPLYPYWIDHEIKEDERHKLLTSRIVLSHQTGFPNWRWNNKDKKLAFDFDPGTQFQYSGEGFEYLRNAIETKFQQPIEDLADSLIFQPLRMTETRFVWDEKMDAAPFALWHDRRGNLYETTKRNEAVASDDLMTTINDYCKFGIHVMEGAGLSQPLFDNMVTAQVKIRKNLTYGLGWQKAENLPNDEYALVHSGSDRGVRTMVILLPKSKGGIVIMTNGDKGNKIIMRVLQENLTYANEILNRI